MAEDNVDAKKGKITAKKAGSLAKRGRSRMPREKVHELCFLLFEQILAECPSFLEEMCRDYGVVVENTYSTISFEPGHNPTFRRVKTFRDVFVAVCVFGRDL